MAKPARLAGRLLAQAVVCAVRSAAMHQKKLLVTSTPARISAQFHALRLHAQRWIEWDRERQVQKRASAFKVSDAPAIHIVTPPTNSSSGVGPHQVNRAHLHLLFTPAVARTPRTVCSFTLASLPLPEPDWKATVLAQFAQECLTACQRGLTHTDAARKNAAGVRLRRCTVT